MANKDWKPTSKQIEALEKIFNGMTLTYQSHNGKLGYYLIDVLSDRVRNQCEKVGNQVAKAIIDNDCLDAVDCKSYHWVMEAYTISDAGKAKIGHSYAS